MASFTSKTPKPILAPIRSNMFDGPAFAQIGARPGAIPGVAGSSASAVSPPGAPAATHGGNLTTPWILFFNQLAQLAEGANNAPVGDFLFGIGGDIFTGQVTATQVIVSDAATLATWRAVATVAAGGAPILLDVLLNGVSIFGGDPAVIPAGSTLAVSGTMSASVNPGDLLQGKVVQAGSSPAGQGVSIQVYAG